MNAHKSRPKRWRLRFSVRALLVATTIVCAYFGSWEATKSWGAADLENYLAQKEISVDSDGIIVRAPFVIEAVEIKVLIHPDPRPDPLDVYIKINSTTLERHDYYLWFFGYITEL